MWCDNICYNISLRIFRPTFLPLVDQFCSEKVSQKLSIFTSFRRIAVRFLADFWHRSGWPTWGEARGFCWLGVFATSENFSYAWEFLVHLGIFGSRGFLAGFKEFFPPLAILIGLAENGQSTKKVGFDIL